VYLSKKIKDRSMCTSSHLVGFYMIKAKHIVKKGEACDIKMGELSQN
jgi:hypothetical protein